MIRRLLFVLLFAGPAFASPHAPEAPSENLSIRLLASSLTPYVGEEVILTLEILHGGRPGARPILQWPALDDFVVDEMPLPPARREQGGALAQSARLALRPLSEGKTILTGGGVRLGDQFHPASPITLRVRPLPVTGRPGGFSGAVGRVTMELIEGASENELTLVLAGSAPLASFPVPRPQDAGATPVLLLDDRTSGFPGGRRERRLRFRLPSGKTDPPTFSLAVFDPTAGLYRQVTTSPEPSPSGWGRLLPGTLLAALLGASVLFFRRRAPISLEESINELLGHCHRHLTRERLVDRLRALGVPPADIADLERLWATGDRYRFAPQESGRRDRQRHTELEREIASRLRKVVDKKARFS